MTNLKKLIGITASLDQTAFPSQEERYILKIDQSVKML